MPIEEKETGAKDVLLFSELYGNMDPTLQLEQETSSLNTGIQRSSATLSKSSHRQNNCDIQSATEPEVYKQRQRFGGVNQLNAGIPAPPPGAPKQQDVDVCSTYLPDGRLNTYNGQQPNARFNEKGQRILPGGGGGARFIPPEEYKEFLQLGHGGVFDLDLDCIDVAPWRQPNVDQSAYFNYGLDERRWRKYVKGIRKARMEQHLNNKIETYTVEFNSTDTDLPVEVRRAISGWEHYTKLDSSQTESQASPLFKSVPTFYEQKHTNDTKLESRQIIKAANAINVNLSDEVRAPERNDHAGRADLVELQRRVESLQHEYKQLLQTGSLTPEKNLIMQQEMLKVKMQIMHGTGFS